MAIPSTCRKCGETFASRLFRVEGGSSRISIGRGVEPCRRPGCDGMADVQSGTYDFINGAVAAFTAPGMTREKVRAVRAVVERASNGDISNEKAIEQLEKISAQLANVIQLHEKKSINWELLLAIIVFVYTLWSGFQSDDAAQAALEEARKSNAIAEKMLEELKVQSSSSQESATGSVSPSASGQKKTVANNRAERRKSAAIKRRERVSPSK